MYKFIPYKRDRLERGHFLAFGVSVEYQVIKNITSYPSPYPSSPLVKLFVNEEERISLLPLPYYRPIFLTTPIYIRGDEEIREETKKIYIGIKDPALDNISRALAVLPRIVLYGYWLEEDYKTESTEKGYLTTTVIPSPASLYEFNINNATLEENIIKRFQFKYNAYLDSIIVYPKYYQINLKELSGVKTNGAPIDFNIYNYSLTNFNITRIDKLMRSGDVEHIYITQYEYDTHLSYVNDNYLKFINTQMKFKAEDYLLIGVNINSLFTQSEDGSVVPLPISSPPANIDLRNEFVFWYSNNEVYPFMLNYRLLEENE